jgi:hypothetical protein
MHIIHASRTYRVEETKQLSNQLEPLPRSHRHKGEIAKIHPIHPSNASITVQRAVEACQRLGIEFLRIDSLCIIQDLHDNCLTQSAKTYEYYSNSWVTIATDGEADSTQGFLRNSSRRVNVNRFDYPGGGEDEAPTSVFIRWKGVGAYLTHSVTMYGRAPIERIVISCMDTLRKSFSLLEFCTTLRRKLPSNVKWNVNVSARSTPHKFPTTEPVKMAIRYSTGSFDGKYVRLWTTTAVDTSLIILIY